MLVAAVMVILLVPVVVALVVVVVVEIVVASIQYWSLIVEVLVPLNIFVVEVLVPYCGFVQLFRIHFYILIILMLFHHILGEEGFREGRAFEGAGGCQRCNKKIS